MNEIILKLTDRELALLTALLGRTNGRDLYNSFDIVRDQVEKKPELVEKYLEAYDVIGEIHGDIEMVHVVREVFGNESTQAE